MAIAGDDRERNPRARTFRVTALGTLGIASAWILLLILLQPESLGPRAVSLACLAVAVPLLLELNRRGRTTLASWGLVVGMIALITYRAWLIGGMQAAVVPLYVIVVMMGGLLLGARGGLVCAMACLSCGVLLVQAGERGAIPVREFDVPPRAMLMYLGMAMGLTLLMQGQTAKTVRESLWRAEAELGERRAAEADRERLVRVLAERVKELRLLHAVAELLQQASPGGLDPLPQLVRLLPAGWQYPECCQARVVHGGVETATPGWRPSPWTQAVDFSTTTGPGRIEVAYTEKRPPADEGPFLAEERATLGSVSEMLVNHLELSKHQRELEGLVARRTAELSSARDAVAASLDRLKELERLRDDLVHMVVHDMRSPLMALMMRLHLVRRHAPQDLQRGIEDALRSADGVNRMANTLLDVSRLETGKMPLQREMADIAALAADARHVLSSMDATRVIELEAPGPVRVTCDPGLVRRVLENLVGNGIKHTPRGGRLRIAVKELPDRVRVTVQDEGPGVPPEARERIFEKFGTVTARRSQGYHSAGLGLAFCKLAVEAHGGTIGVEPALPHGSVFWLELPTSTAAPAPRPEAPEGPAIETG
jgi:signal transduction histidine kinase